MPEKFVVDNAVCVKETNDAILVSAEDFFDEDEWVPKSVIHNDSEVYKLDTDGDLIVYYWWATKKGWD